MLSDIETLINECYHASSKELIAEAYQCYSTGSYRAAVVSTWLAVLSDTFSKLRELGVSGDKRANEIVSEYEESITKGEYKTSNSIERRILEVIRDEFEFINVVEYTDLSRIQEDRNRCAHLAVISSGEFFRVTPELARNHIRNALQHILQHRPVQGKAALESIAATVTSKYFPTKLPDAIKTLKESPLAKPKESLLRNWVIYALKKIHNQENDMACRIRYIYALAATHDLHQAETTKWIKQKWYDILMVLDDAFLVYSLILLWKLGWNAVDIREDCRIRLEKLIAECKDANSSITIRSATYIPGFETVTATRISKLDLDEICSLAEKPVSVSFEMPVLVQLIHFYKLAGNFASANQIGSAIQNLKGAIDKERALEVVDCYKNGQVRGSNEFKNILNLIGSLSVFEEEEWKTILEDRELTILTE